MYQSPYNNPYYGTQMYSPMQRVQPTQPVAPQNIQNDIQFNQQPIYRQPMNLQGKIVDSIEVVKATDVPLDGSISYYPLTDGSLIATKQIGLDGKSKIILYKQVEEEKNEEKSIQYVTQEELEAKISGLNLKDIKDIKEDIKTLKRGLEDVTDSMSEKKGK